MEKIQLNDRPGTQRILNVHSYIWKVLKQAGLGFAMIISLTLDTVIIAIVDNISQRFELVAYKTACIVLVPVVKNW